MVCRVYTVLLAETYISQRLYVLLDIVSMESAHVCCAWSKGYTGCCVLVVLVIALVYCYRDMFVCKSFSTSLVFCFCSIDGLILSCC